MREKYLTYGDVMGIFFNKQKSQPDLTDEEIQWLKMLHEFKNGCIKKTETPEMPYTLFDSKPKPKLTMDVKLSPALRRSSPEELKIDIDKSNKGWFTCADLAKLFRSSEGVIYSYILSTEYALIKGKRKYITKQNLLEFINDNLVSS